jgi:hypothetical protein
VANSTSRQPHAKSRTLSQREICTEEKGSKRRVKSHCPPYFRVTSSPRETAVDCWKRGHAHTARGATEGHAWVSNPTVVDQWRERRIPAARPPSTILYTLFGWRATGATHRRPWLLRICETRTHSQRVSEFAVNQAECLETLLSFPRYWISLPVVSQHVVAKDILHSILGECLCKTVHAASADVYKAWNYSIYITPKYETKNSCAVV